MTFARVVTSAQPKKASGQLRRALSAVALALCCLPLSGLGGQAVRAPARCSQDASLYESKGYQVRAIRFSTFFDQGTPLAFIFAVQKLLNQQYQQIKSQLPLREGQRFSAVVYISAQDKLRELLGRPDAGERLKFVYLEPVIEACDDNAAPPTLEIVYRIFTTQGLSYLTSIFENSPRQFSRQTLGILQGAADQHLPQPFAGYNASRGLFAGGRASLQLNSGIFDRLDAEASGSASSAVAKIGFSGRRDYDSGLIGHTEWRFGYHYANIPANELALKEGTLLAQSFIATRPLGSPALVLRFGTAIEGGNRQSHPGGEPIADANLGQTSYGALKTYVGGTASLNRQSWKASYALQLGENTAGLRVDYLKQIVDSAYSLRWLPREHLPLRMDLQFTAGAIHRRSGAIPVNERFFGGNSQGEFIQGDDWRIGSSPLIRSFPQNRFNRLAGGPPIGGENFISANLTISQALWKRPAIPQEVSNDVDLKIALGGAILTNKSVAIADGLDATAELKKLVNDLSRNLTAGLNQLQMLANGLQASSPPPPVLEALSDLQDSLSDASDAITTLNQSKSVLAVQPLILGFPDAGIASAIDSVSESGEALAQSLQTAGLSGPLDGFRQSIKQLSDEQLAGRTAFEKVKRLAYVEPQSLQPAVERLDEVSRLLQSIKQILDGLATVSDNRVVEGVSAAQKYLRAAMDNVQAAQSKGENAKVNLELLTRGLGAVTPAAISGLMENSRRLQKPLAQVGLATEAAQLDGAVRQLSVLRAEIEKALQKVATPVVERRANQDIAYTGRTLDVIFRELNIVDLSPVLTFDAARIGEKSPVKLSETRYGVGTGIRFSLVTMEVTTGYSWNLRRKPGEPRGALIFALEIRDLFR